MGWLGRLDVPARTRRWVPQWLTSILVGLAASGLAMAGRALLLLVWADAVPFGLLFPAILLATLFGRWQAGLTCFIVGGLGTWYLALAPYHSFAIPDAATGAILAFYAVVGGLILAIAEAYRQALHQLAHERRESAAAEARRQRLLTQELNHRIKNMLATVQAIASQTLGRAAIPPEARQAFDARLAALARAHDLLTRAAWSEAAFEDLVTSALAPFDNGKCFRINGPALSLPSQHAVAMALGLHELATNAVKYGALSVPDGSVDLSWSIEGGRFRLTWIERDGPKVAAPAASGFGTRLLERALAVELGGSVRLEYPADGARCEIEAPLPDTATAE
ncbi:MAG: sensor histidine kinase [Sphingomonadales bacterium]